MPDKRFKISQLVKYQSGLAIPLLSLTILSLNVQANEAIPIRSLAADLQPAAQTLPLQRQQQPLPIPSPVSPSPFAEPPELKVPASSPQPPSSSPGKLPSSMADTFRVEKFVFESNTISGRTKLVFSPAQLNEVVRTVVPQLPADITFAQLLQIRTAITQFYVKKGYITSGAYIPAGQKFDGQNTTVKIRIVEGRLEKIREETTSIDLNDDSKLETTTVDERIEVWFLRPKKECEFDRKNPNRQPEPEKHHGSDAGLGDSIRCREGQRLTRDYVRNRFDVREPLSQQALLDALRVLQVDPKIAKVDAELLPGSQPGRNQLKLTVTEAKSLCSFSFSTVCGLFQIAVNNARSPSVGSDHRQVQLNLDDSKNEANLNLLYGNTRGSNSIDSAFIQSFDQGEKENLRYKAILFRFGRTWNNIIERPFNQLDINTDSSYVDVAVRASNARPGSRSEFAWNFTVSWQQSKSSLLGIDLPLSRDADIAGRTKVFTLRVAPEWTLRNPQSVLSLRGEVSYGFNAGPGETFAIFRGQGQWARLLAPETLFLARVNTQLASGPLPVLEQITFGGQDSLRGYRQNFLLADNGVYASVELQLPVLRFQLFNEPAVIQVVPFVDFSVAGNSSKADNALTIPPLWSTGIGLQARLSDRFKARVDFSFPLVTTDSQGNSLPKQDTYFTVSGILAF